MKQPPLGRSSLYVWMRDNRVTFRDRLADTRPGVPFWNTIAVEMTRRGLRNTHGGQPSTDVCRRTWYEVRQDWKAGRFDKRPSPVVAEKSEALPYRAGATWDQWISEHSAPALSDESPGVTIVRASVRKP